MFIVDGFGQIKKNMNQSLISPNVFDELGHPLVSGLQESLKIFRHVART